MQVIDWVRQTEHHQHESALEAYQMCLELFDNHVDAAVCRNDLQRVVELEEQGRGQQWSLASPLRIPLDDLQGSTGADQAAIDRAATEYKELTEQWEVAVAEVCDLQDFLRFLLTPSYEGLQGAVRHGPVIVLIVSIYSWNAVIVPASGGPHHVSFLSLTLLGLKTLKDNFAREIRHVSLFGPTEPRTELRVLLQTVWDEIMLPVIKVLQHDLEFRRRPGMWLCPTAAFTSLLVHATHPCRTKADRYGRELCLEDIYLCSYTPTLSALIRAR
ncbi:hypothetical protein DFJ58DRAFT_722162 [Suillus subalutaceus]|uniref:uncharacterized protein n=1 Tax=Suillus subalutaceus TaxID=48586 RepID=UPI001B87E24C|nr:uncharacterized protein DFJ58DRAFT_722162 [Suillus subalutaceus]KAG1872992.1 hypothetical protein DFJ58DRAFT_722162 [Suillus subalutaceus]